MKWRASFVVVGAALAACGAPTETPAKKEATPPPKCAIAGCITTVIGTGKAAFGDDDVLGWKSDVYAPQGMATGPDGKLYYIDWNNHRVRIWDPKSELTTTVVGTGELGDIGHGGDPLAARMNHPTTILFDGSGRLLIAAWHNSKIKRVDFAAKKLEDICGTGARAFGGDGAEAKKAKLDLPSGIALDSKAELYIADQANERIRKVDAKDVISTVVGGAWVTDTGKKDGAPKVGKACKDDTACGLKLCDAGKCEGSDKFYTDCTGTPIADLDNDAVVQDSVTKAWNKQKDAQGNAVKVPLPAADLCGGFTGDGGPALEAKIMSPKAQSAFPAGRIHIAKDVLYIADTANHRVRKVDLASGTITTLAGKGTAGFSGDGGKATDAELNTPVDVDTLADGTVLIADLLNHCVRAVKADGTTISTFAGQCGQIGFAGDGGAATKAKLNWPFAIHVDPKGDVWIADSFNQRVRRVSAK
jgi:sugar lactone lactonase YvrE